MNDWAFYHVTISLGYSRSNGQVERGVQTVKKLIKIARYDPFNVLLEYRNTPVDGLDGVSNAFVCVSAIFTP